MSSTLDEDEDNNQRHDYQQASDDRDHPGPTLSRTLRGRSEILLDSRDIILRCTPCRFAAQPGVTRRTGKLSFWNSVYLLY